MRTPVLYTRPLGASVWLILDHIATVQAQGEPDLHAASYESCRYAIERSAFDDVISRLLTEIAIRGSHVYDKLSRLDSNVATASVIGLHALEKLSELRKLMSDLLAPSQIDPSWFLSSLVLGRLTDAERYAMDQLPPVQKKASAAYTKSQNAIKVPKILTPEEEMAKLQKAKTSATERIEKYEGIIKATQIDLEVKNQSVEKYGALNKQLKNGKHNLDTWQRKLATAIENIDKFNEAQKKKKEDNGDNNEDQASHAIKLCDNLPV